MNATIENNQYTASTAKLQPYHSVQDQAKFDALCLSMSVNGWVGSPLVKFDDCLLTGSHRYAAARHVGLDIPVVDLFDVFCVDQDEVIELIQTLDVWQVEVTHLAIEDNAEIAAELGMDIC
jgi:ParB-like chromosome segregation protein Spo0J